MNFTQLCMYIFKEIVILLTNTKDRLIHSYSPADKRGISEELFKL